MDKRRYVIIAVASLVGILAVIAVIWIVYSQSSAYKVNSNTSVAKENIIFSDMDELEEGPSNDSSDLSQTQKATEVPVIELAVEDIRTFLFLGIDRTEERDEFFSIYRSDSISLLRLDMNGNWAKVLSIPRDSYMYLPITDRLDKINHAFAYGSLKGRAEASVLEALTIYMGTEMTKKYFAVEMEPIPEVVDSIGGIELDVEIDIKSHGADIDKGLQVLYGKDAYDYVHWRYSGNGDIGRIGRQQNFVAALLKQLPQKYDYNELSKLLLKNTSHYNTNIHISELTDIIKVLTSIEDLEFSMIEGSGKTIEGVSYWVPDEELNNQIIEAFFSTPNKQ